MAFIDPRVHVQFVEQELPPGTAAVRVEGRQHLVAPLGKRFAAGMIDFAVLLALLVVVWLVAEWQTFLDDTRWVRVYDRSPFWHGLCVAVVLWWCGLQSFLSARPSLGKDLLGLRIASTSGDGRPTSPRVLLLRELPWRATPWLLVPVAAFHAELVALGIAGAAAMFLLARSDSLSRTPYDRLAGTAVVLQEKVPLVEQVAPVTGAPTALPWLGAPAPDPGHYS